MSIKNIFLIIFTLAGIPNLYGIEPVKLDSTFIGTLSIFTTYLPYKKQLIVIKKKLDKSSKKIQSYTSPKNNEIITKKIVKINNLITDINSINVLVNSSFQNFKNQAMLPKIKKAVSVLFAEYSPDILAAKAVELLAITENLLKKTD